MKKASLYSSGVFITYPPCFVSPPLDSYAKLNLEHKMVYWVWKKGPEKHSRRKKGKIPVSHLKFLALYQENFHHLLHMSGFNFRELLSLRKEKNATAMGVGCFTKLLLLFFSRCQQLRLLIKKTLIKYSSRKKGFCSPPETRCPRMRFEHTGPVHCRSYNDRKKCFKR